MEYYSVIKNEITLFFRKMDGTEDHHVKQDKSDSDKNITCFLLYVEFRVFKNRRHESRRTIWREEGEHQEKGGRQQRGIGR
jgi:hypothetical protein